MSYNPFLRKQNSASDNPFLTKRTNEQQQDEEIGYLDSLTKGLKSGGAGVYRDMAYLVGADDTNKYLDSIVQDNAPNKQFDSIWSMDYVTDPEGLTRTIGDTVGSSLALAPAALALPETAAAGAAGLAVKGLGKLGLKKAAQWGATEAGKKALKLGARGAMTSLPESASEWGGAAEEAEAMGSKTPRADTVSVLGGNMVTLPASNALEYMLLGGKLFHPTAKLGEGLATRAIKAPLRMVPSVAANATQNAAEELVQQTLSDNAVGKPVGNPFLPGSWTDEQRISFEQGLAGGAGLAGIGGGARALRRNNAPNAIERKAAEEQPEIALRRAPIADGIEDFDLGKTDVNLVNGVNDLNSWAYDNFGKDLIISGGYRNAEHNAAVNGSPTSYHLYGQALDVDASNFTEDERKQIEAKAREMGFNSNGEDMYHDKGSGLHFHLILPDGNLASPFTTRGTPEAIDFESNSIYDELPAEVAARNAAEVEKQLDRISRGRGFVVDDVSELSRQQGMEDAAARKEMALSPVDAYLAEQERVRNETMAERWDEAAGRSGFMPQSYYDNPVDFYLNQRFIEMIEKAKRTNGKETVAAKIEVPKKYLNSDAAVRGLRGLERDTAEGIWQMYPDDLAKGWKQEQQRVQKRYYEMLEPALKELRSGMKQGVEVIRPDGEDKGYRASRNAPWYSDFYRQYKRPPTQAELRELAYETMTGQRNILPGFENNSAESAAYFAEQKQAFDSMRSQLAAFDAIKGRMTGDKKENADTQLVTPGTYVQAVERAKSDLAGTKTALRREKLAERAVNSNVAIKATEGMLDGDAAATDTFNSYIPEVRSALLNKIGEERGYDVKTDERREDQLQDAEFKQGEEGKDKAGAQDENAEAVNKKSVSVEENIANGEKAMRRVIDTHDDVESAMYREDIGDIDFVWGKEGRGEKFKGGYGIAHIIAKRDAEGISGNDFVLNIPKTIALGKVSGKQEASNGDRVLISNGSKTVVLSLFKDGNRKTWLVTGWDESAYENKKTTPSAAEAVYDADSATGKGTTRSRSDTDGVVLSTTNISPASQNVKESKKATEIIKETEEKHEPVKKEDVPELDEDIQFYVKSDPDGGFYIHRNGANEHLQEFDNFKDAVNYQKKNRDSLLKQVRGEKVVEGEPAKYSIKNKSEALQTKTPEFKRWFGQSKVVDENGEPLVVYHGTKRADRVGNVFRPDRATSGPMAFFTDNKEIAENYSKDKADTSLAAEFGDGSYYEQFRVKTKWGDYSIRNLWGYIPINKRIELSKRAGEITLDDEGEIIIEHGNTKGIGNYDYELKENRGDAVKALVEGWLNGGTLFGEEGRFIEVLEKAGILDAAEAVGIPKENIYYNDPNKTDAAVYPVYMKIEKPFDTSKDITKKVIQELERAAKKAPPATDRAVDMWDKQGVDPSDWVERLQDDFDQGTSFAWTTIPDFVTDYLKAKGYDGIKDTGGKSGGNGHNVYIPFESTQIKSATDNVGSFDADNPDIRYGIKNDKGEELNPIALDEWEAQAKDAFPNAKNFSRDGSVMEFDLPNGEHMRINVVDRVVLDDAEFERAQADYGGKLERDAEVLGSVRTIGKNAFMTLAQENVRGTIDHEALHYARTHGLTGRENAALERAFKGNEEAMAEAYRKWRIKWKELKEGSDWGKLWRKVKDFAAKVADFLGFETEHDIFRKIESGEVWERGSNNGKTDSSYKVTNSQITGETRIPVVDVTGLPKVDVNSSSQKVAIARSLIGKTFRIIGSNGIGRVASMGDGRHLVGGSNNPSRTDTVRRQALSTVENVLNNAVYIEKHLDGQHGTKNRYVELYAVVKDGNNLTRFRIVAKEGNGNSSEFEVKDAKFYDIIKDGTLSPSMPKSISTAQLPDGNQSQLKDNIPSSTVSVAELLTGVKDRQGVPYVNRDGGLNYDAEALKGIKHSMRKTTNYDELLDPAHIKKINNVERAKVAKLVKSFKLDGYKGRPIVVMDNANEGYIGLTGSHRIAAAEEVGVEIPAVVIPANGETVKLLDVRDDDELATVAETLHNNNEISDNAYQLLTEEDSHWNDVKYSILSKKDDKKQAEPKDLTSGQKAARAFTNTERKGTVKSAVDWMIDAKKNAYTNWIDKNDSLHGFDEAISMGLGRKLSDDESVYNKAQTMRANAAGLASALIEGDERSIEAINERLKNKKLPHKVTLAMVLDTVNRKVMDKRYPDYLQRNDFKNWADAVGTYLGCMRLREMAKIVRDAYESELAEWRANGSKGKMPEFKPYKLPGRLTEADLKAVIYGSPTEFKLAADLYYKFNDNLLTVMEDAGLISAEVHRLLNTKYKYYAPLMRDFSDTAAADNFIGGLQGLGRGIANVSSTLKKISIEGSERRVLNPLESTIKAVAVVASRAERNKVGQAAVALAGESGLEGAVWKVPGSSADAKNCIFTVMEDGKKVAYQTTPELYGPIVGYNETSAGVVFGLLRNSARLLRSGATMSPSFILRNLIRDTLFAGISSKTGFIPVLDTVRGIHALLRNPKLRAEFEAAGVNKFNFYGSNEAIAKSLDDLTGGKAWQDYGAGDIWRALLKYPALFSELAESGTRMGEFMRARKQGISIDEAARYARELTLDFSRSGVQGEKFNQIVPFFNACLQGGDKMIRLLKNDPVNTMTALGKYIIVPSILLWCLNHDEDWYKELDPEVKNTCWCLPGGIRIPKPQEAGIFFGSGVEAILDMASNEDPAAMENFGKTFLANASPNFLPTLFLPIVEWQANYSFFRGQPLTGKRLERLPDELQYNPGTSEAAKAIGSVTKWSPVKIDNTIRGYTGTMGMFLAQVFDPLVAEKRNMPTKKFGELTFIRDFTLNDNIKNRSVNDFYDMLAAANEQHSGYGVKGKPTAVVKNIRKAGELISKANKDIRNITTSTALSPDEKRARIDKRKEYIRNVAKKANQLYGKYY